MSSWKIEKFVRASVPSGIVLRNEPVPDGDAPVVLVERCAFASTGYKAGVRQGMKVLSASMYQGGEEVTVFADGNIENMEHKVNTINRAMKPPASAYVHGADPNYVTLGIAGTDQTAAAAPTRDPGAGGSAADPSAADRAADQEWKIIGASGPFADAAGGPPGGGAFLDLAT